MLNQGQGTYPQLAGSFYNSAQMMPHDNGRNAQQVPTFFTGLQNMMSASTAMQNYQGMPLSQSILSTQALATNRYNNSLPGLIGGVGTGLGIAGTVGGIGMMAGVGGGIASTLAAPPLLLAGLAAGGVASAYKKRMAVVDDMKNALQGSRLGYGLADPVTGSISNTAAFDLSDQLKFSAAGSGFKDKDLTKTLGQASGLGMLDGMQSLGDVTKKVTDLAKASREIVMLGEGISMTDAMQLQKLTQDMGIGTSKFRGKNIGKNLVMAARAAGMSMDQAAQVGGQGAITFQQLGLGAASGMNAAFFSNIAAKGLTGAGAFSQRQLSALGGEQGIAQNLLAGQAGTMARMSDSLVMGSVKLASDGQFRIDRDLLDRYVRGEVTAKDMMQRGKDIGKGMSKRDRSHLLEGLQFQMPELKEQMTDMLSSEEMMAIQGREILNLSKKKKMSMRRAAQTYFGDSAQAETFLGYAQNYRASRAEADRQHTVAQQERMYKYAGMAKSSSLMSRAGRGIVHAAEAVGDFVSSPFTETGEYFAKQTVKYQDEQARGLRRIMGVDRGYSRTQIGDLGATVYGGTTAGRSLLDYDRGGKASPNNLIGGKYASYSEMVKDSLDVSGEFKDLALDSLLKKLKLTSGLNVAGGGGASQRLTQFLEGDYNMIRKIGDFTGIEDDTEDSIEKIQKIATFTDEAMRMGRAQTNRGFNYRNDKMRSAYGKVVEHIRTVSRKAEQGIGTGDYAGVQSSDIGMTKLTSLLGDSGLTDEQKEAVIGQAYRGFSTMEGKAGAGFSAMMTKYTNLAGILDLGEQKPQELDTVRLEGKGKGVLKAKGLSRALSESKMSLSEGDFDKLIAAMTDPTSEIDGGKDSTEAILRKARIPRHRYAGKHMAGVRKIIDALRGAQITTGRGKDKKTVSLAEAFRKDIGSIKTKRGSVREAAHLDALERMKALDNEMSDIYGDGAAHLREDLQSSLALDLGSEADIDRAYRHAFETKADAGGRLGSKIKSVKNTNLKSRRKDLNKQKTQLTAKIEKLKNNSVARDSGVLEKLVQKRKGIEASLADSSGMEADALESAKKELFRGFKGKHSKEGVIDAYNRDKGSLLALGKTSLSETLQGLADSGGKTAEDKAERRKAYAKLMQGSLGTELEDDFRNMRSSLTGVTDAAKRRDTESKFMERVFQKARAANIEVPGMPKAKSLPKILGEISEGIDQFKKTMQAVSKITNNNGVLEINLPSPR
jgi:hypothetical protein